MLSICIPIYNQDITQLVKDLHQQAESLNINYEILLYDDCSPDLESKIQNRKLKSFKNITYIELENNIGRSAIRNKLAEDAQFQYLIFMDCDAAVYKDDYLQTYLNFCTTNIVCYGGRQYPELKDGKNKLRWLYGYKRETRPASVRNIHPNQSFITFNFLIDKKIFNILKFDESLKTYGHEDTLFGLQLETLGIGVKHIDNELLNNDLEDAELFLNKTEDGIENLLTIMTKISPPRNFMSSIKLLRAYNLVSKLYLVGIVSLLFKLSKNKIRKNLLGTHPSLFLFDFYKLGYLCNLNEKVKS